MAKKIEKQEEAVFASRFPDDRRYIYFIQPPELWMGTQQYEDHESILRASGRDKTDIRAIGFANQFDPDEVVFDHRGSLNLRIEAGNPQECVSHIRSLPKSRTIRFLVK